MTNKIWLACAKARFGELAEHRHLITPGDPQALCGFQTDHHEEWRKDSRKNNCNTCQKIEKGASIV